MKLLKYELIKLGKKGMFLALFFLLIAANLLTLYTMERHTSVYFYVHEQQENFHRFMEGDDRADIDGYYGLEQSAQESYIDTYVVFVEEMADRVDRMGKTSLYADKESFVYRNLIKTQEDFASFSGAVLVPDNCFGIRGFANYNGGILFVLVFIAVLAYYVLFEERSLNLMLLLKGCRRGHTPLAAAKFAAMLIATAGYILIQEILAIFLFAWMYGFGDLGRIIQSVSVFRNCAYHLTVWGALAVIVAVRITVGVFFACTVFFIGMIEKNETAAIAVSGVVFGVAFLLEQRLEISGSLDGLKCINPFYYWNMRQVLGEYHNLNLFGYPVSKDVCAFVSALFLEGTLPVAGCIVFNGTYQIRTESRLERVVQWLRGRMGSMGRRLSLLYYECYKMLIQQKKGIILVAFFVWGVYEAAGVYAPTYYASAEDAAYHHYISLVQGPVTEETFTFFEEEGTRLDDLRRESREFLEGDSPEGAVMGQVLQIEIQMLEDGFEAARQQLYAIQEMPGNIWDKFMIDERAYKEIWQDIGTDVCLWLGGSSLVLFLVSGIYPVDEKKKMLPFLRTMRNGETKLDRSKNCCAILVAGIVYVTMELPLLLRYQKIDHFAAASQRLCDFTGGIFISTCPLWLMIAAVFLLKALSFLAVAWTGVRLSRLTKNEMVTLVAGIGVIGMIAMILYRLGWDVNMLLIHLL